MKRAMPVKSWYAMCVMTLCIIIRPSYFVVVSALNFCFPRLVVSPLPQAIHTERRSQLRDDNRCERMTHSVLPGHATFSLRFRQSASRDADGYETLCVTTTAAFF